VARHDGHTSPKSDASSAGFTLIELLIVVGIMPLVIGALAVGILSVFTLQSSVANRLTDSGDEQLVSLNFQNDVQSAALITTASSPTSAPTTPCEPSGSSGYQVLGLQLGNGNVISYTAVAAASGAKTYSLFRNVCDTSGKVTSSSVVAHDMPASIVNPATPLVTITCTVSSTTCALGAGNTPAYAVNWQPTVGITGVYFKATAPASNYTYQVVAVPAASSSSTQLAKVATPSTGCGFATPGTGFYASTLCFVNFAPWNAVPQVSAPDVSCGSAQPGYSTPFGLSAGISNTPFTLSFCMSVRSSLNGTAITGQSSAGAACGVAARAGWDDITAVPLPTYACPPTSEAFLGNNGFYTGVPGDPGLYTVEDHSVSTIAITNIQLLGSNGQAATGWELVTGDAESTDTSESITWSSNQDLSLLDNTTISPVGNACQSTPPSFNATYLTGVGTTTVECSSTISEDHTGTVMLQAKTPSSLTVTLVGGGLQAMFLGVLLP
jgi:type II secretory pathway pseudopilin PulG